jgi:hypothetical protein
VQQRLEAQRVELFNPISKIFGGERKHTELVAELDDIDTAAVMRLLEYIGRPSEALAPGWPDMSSLDAPTEQVERLLRDHQVEFKRIAQLAVPKVAKSTGPRFCAGGVEEEKRQVTERLLNRLEDGGFGILEPIRRIWAGERDIDAACAGCDSQDRHIVVRILVMVVETPAALPVDERRASRVAQCLRNEDSVFKIIAKLAVAPETEQTLLQRSLVSANVYEDLEGRGLELGVPVQRMFSGERDAVQLTAEIDDMDTACVNKVHKYF